MSPRLAVEMLLQPLIIDDRSPTRTSVIDYHEIIDHLFIFTAR